MDARRLPTPTDAETAARDSQVEALLVDGLDHYFARRYDEAIHLWTRVLFLDRSHARARAYIERARTAQAERQRRGEELLATGHSLIDEGRPDAARDLLAEAVATTGEDERASALRLRLERVERVRGPAVSGAATPIVANRPAGLRAWVGGRRAWFGAGILAGAAGIVVVSFTAPAALQDVVGLSVSRADVGPPAAPVPVPVLSSADVALVRARNLFGRGRLAEALQALDRVGPESPSRAAADSLRIEIQRLLLASGRESSSPPAGTDPQTP